MTKEIINDLTSVKFHSNYILNYVNKIEDYKTISSLLNKLSKIKGDDSSPDEHLMFTINDNPLLKHYKLIENVLSEAYNVLREDSVLIKNFKKSNNKYICLFDEIIDLVSYNRNIFVSNMPIGRVYLNNRYITYDVNTYLFENLEEFKKVIDSSKLFAIYLFEITDDLTIKVRGKSIDFEN